MTLEELEAAGRLASAIKSARDALAEAEKRLALLNTSQVRRAKSKGLGLADLSWEPTLILEAGGRYGQDTTVKVRLPFGVVQQQLVDDVKRAKRRLVQLEMQKP